MKMRTSEIIRNTNETKIEVRLNIDGSGKSEISTGIGFFDHMLSSFARHGFFDLSVMVDGDLYVDTHHTIEDTGIVIGEAIKQAIKDKSGIKRYGSAILPMDEALVLCSLDLSSRPYLVFDLELDSKKVGEFETQMVKEFFYAISYSAGMNFHIKKFSGSNDHHIVECAFKAFAKALDDATKIDTRISGVLSTKGSL